MRRFSTLFVVLSMVLGFAVAADAQVVDLNVDVSVQNKYVWRGLELLPFRPFLP